MNLNNNNNNNNNSEPHQYHHHNIPTSLTHVKTVVAEPAEADVLCGVNVNKQAAHHPGNCLLREQIESCLDEYQDAKTKQKKMKINRLIMSTMKEKYGARFLAKRNGVWILMDEQGIRDTVSRALRVGALKKEKKRFEIQQTLAKLEQLGEQHAITAATLPLSSSSLSSVPTMKNNHDASVTNYYQAIPKDGLFQHMVDRVHRSQLQILNRMFSHDDKATRTALGRSATDKDASFWFAWFKKNALSTSWNVCFLTQ